MSSILDGLGQFILQYPAWAHFIIGASILIQGEIAILVSVFLIVSGKLSWGDFLLVAPTSLIIGETVIYFLGRMFRNTRFGWRFYRERIKPNKQYQFYFYYLRTHLTRLLIGAKFLIGVNILVLVLTGWTKTKFGTFIRSYIPGVTIWFVSITSISYFLMSGLSYLKTAKLLKEAEYGIILVVAVIFIAEFIVRRIINKRIPFQKEEKFIEEDESDAKA